MQKNIDYRKRALSLSAAGAMVSHVSEEITNIGRQHIRRLTAVKTGDPNNDNQENNEDITTRLPRLSILPELKRAAKSVAAQTVVDSITKAVQASASSPVFHRGRSKTAGGVLQNNR